MLMLHAHTPHRVQMLQSAVRVLCAVLMSETCFRHEHSCTSSWPRSHAMRQWYRCWHCAGLNVWKSYARQSEHATPMQRSQDLCCDSRIRLKTKPQEIDIIYSNRRSLVFLSVWKNASKSVGWLIPFPIPQEEKFDKHQNATPWERKMQIDSRKRNTPPTPTFPRKSSLPPLFRPPASHTNSELKYSWAAQGELFFTMKKIEAIKDKLRLWDYTGNYEYVWVSTDATAACTLSRLGENCRDYFQKFNPVLNQGKKFYSCNSEKNWWCI